MGRVKRLVHRSFILRPEHRFDEPPLIPASVAEVAQPAAEHHGHPCDWLVTVRLAVSWRPKEAIMARVFVVAPEADLRRWLPVVLREYILAVRVQADPFFLRPRVAVAARILHSEDKIIDPVRSAVADEVVACHSAPVRVE
jgi:hypothetical protein